jgi:hypothetical protein
MTSPYRVPWMPPIAIRAVRPAVLRRLQRRFILWKSRKTLAARKRAREEVRYYKCLARACYEDIAELTIRASVGNITQDERKTRQAVLHGFAGAYEKYAARARATLISPGMVVSSQNRTRS